MGQKQSIKKALPFTHVFYINLMKRPKRDIEINQELAKFRQTMTITKIYASENKYQGFQGCTQSHIRALQRALVLDEKWVLIFEDDFQWKMSQKKLEHHLQTFFSEFKTANILMLEINPLNVEKTQYKNIYRVNKGLATASYLVRTAYIPKMLKNLHESYELKRRCDVGFLELQKDKSWFALQPPAGIQRPGYSDIEYRQVNYGV